MSRLGVGSKTGQRLFGLIALALLAGLSSAEDPPRRTVLDVAVTDTDGRFVTSLKASDFLLFEHGQPRAVQAFIAPDAPWNIAVMIDTDAWLLTQQSRSGTTPDRTPERAVTWPWIGDAVASLQATLRPADRISLAAFDEDWQMKMAWVDAQDPSKRFIPPPPVLMQGATTGAVLSNLKQAYMGKDFYGAIEWMAKRFANVKGRHDVVVFTDGRDLRLSMPMFRNGAGRPVTDPFFLLPDALELSEFDAMLRTVKGNGVRVHIANVNSDRTPYFPALDMTQGPSISPIYRGAAEGVESYLSLVGQRTGGLAAASGGTVLYKGHARGTDAVFQTLAARLGVGRTYRLEVIAENPAGAPVENIEIRVRDPQLRATVWTPEPAMRTEQ